MRVQGLEGVCEERALVEDARHARAADHLVAEKLVPEVFDGFDLGEETVSADVEPVALIFDRARDAADDVVALEHDGLDARLGKLIGGGQAGGAGSQHNDGGLFHAIYHHTRRRAFACLGS
ncbi:MAG: hypothetical protein R2724_27640 [Bryobacterales bacterium]